jgi:hypothetical protein
MPLEYTLDEANGDPIESEGGAFIEDEGSSPDSTALAIALGEYVIVQDEKIDQPKIIILDSVTLTESVALIMPLNASVFEAVFVQDLPSVLEQASVSFTVSVFDTVIVNEGEEDNLNFLISVEDTVSVDDTTATIKFTLLRVSAFDVVTVLDSVGIFAQGANGIVTFDTLLVQEFLTLKLTMEINAFDNVHVADGANAPDVFDAVTVVEDVTVKLARLVVSVFDTVTVTESRELDGLNISVIAGISGEDLLVSESVTVFLAQLRPTVFDAVSLEEAVTVSVSSIAMSVNVFDTVTVADVVMTLQLNPLEINEFTEVTVVEVVDVVTGILLITVADTVTVTEVVTMALSFLRVEAADDVSVTERVALKITTGGQSKTSDLPVVGAGR